MERRPPAVSVLVPVYRSARFLDACLESVTTQTFTDFEAVVVDDCSDDDSYRIAEAWSRKDDRVSARRNSLNLGSRGNFSFCLGLARAQLIKFVCADDVLRADAIERQAAILASRVDVALVTSRRLMIDEGGKVAGEVAPLTVTQPVTVLDGYEAGNLALCSAINWIGEPTTTMFRAGALVPGDGMYRLGSRTPARNLDLVWWLKILTQGSVAYVDEPLSSFRRHPGQQSQDPRLQKDLVLSWFDIVEGASELGYLAADDARVQAWSKLLGVFAARLPTLPDEARAEMGVILQELGCSMAGARSEVRA